MNLDALIDFYQTLTPASVSRFGDFYAEDAYFKDPFNEVRGLKPIAEVVSLQTIMELDAIRMIQAAVKTVRQISRVRDEETGTHLERMSRYARLIALRMAPRKGMSDEWVEFLFQFSPLHDVGKIAVPDQILFKPGRLTTEEFEIMKNHVGRGNEIVQVMAETFRLTQAPYLRVLRNVVAHHHECLDGSGYPAGLSGEEVSLEGRIVAVADVFDALTSTRPYKKAWSVDDALNFLTEQAGKKFDPEAVEVLKQAVRPSPTSSGNSPKRRWTDRMRALASLAFLLLAAPALADAYARVRAHTEALAAPLSAEDQVIQSMPDASPTKWHRAHTTWFFEQFVLVPHAPGYRVFDERLAFLYNSYYLAAGPRHARPRRGMITRPSNAEVADYRAHVDAAMARLLADPAALTPAQIDASWWGPLVQDLPDAPLPEWCNRQREVLALLGQGAGAVADIADDLMAPAFLAPEGFQDKSGSLAGPDNDDPPAVKGFIKSTDTNGTPEPPRFSFLVAHKL